MRFPLKKFQRCNPKATPFPTNPKFQSLWSMAGVPFHKLLCLKRTWVWTKKKQGPQAAAEENVIPNS